MEDNDALRRQAEYLQEALEGATILDLEIKKITLFNVGKALLRLGDDVRVENSC